MRFIGASSLILITIISFMISGCCTKKDCDYRDYPTLNVRLVNFNISGTGYVKIYERSTLKLIDSTRFFNNFFRIAHLAGEFDIREKRYLIFSDNNRVDTVHDINFEIFEFNNDCNRCFLADNSDLAIDFKDLEYSLNGLKFKGVEDIEISN